MRVFYEFVVLNSVLCIGLVALWDLGIVDQVLDNDASRISLAICALFSCTFGWQAFIAWKTGKYITAVVGQKKVINHKRVAFVRHRLSSFKFTSGVLVTLGLIGTFVGFAMALKSLTPDAVGNADAAGELVVVLGSGLGVAIYTTITGAVLGLWLDVNRWLIQQRVDEYEYKWKSGS